MGDLIKVDGRGGYVDFALGRKGVEAVHKLRYGGLGGAVTGVKLPVT